MEGDHPGLAMLPPQIQFQCQIPEIGQIWRSGNKCDAAVAGLTAQSLFLTCNYYIDTVFNCSFHLLFLRRFYAIDLPTKTPGITNAFQGRNSLVFIHNKALKLVLIFAL